MCKEKGLQTYGIWGQSLSEILGTELSVLDRSYYWGSYSSRLGNRRIHEGRKYREEEKRGEVGGLTQTWTLPAAINGLYTGFTPVLPY